MATKFSFFSSDHPHFPPERLSKEDSIHEKVTFKVWIARKFKRSYLLGKKRKQEQKPQLKMGMEFKLTLEEWLLQSPSVNKSGIYNDEHCGYKNHYVARKNAYFADSREHSCSLEKLLNGANHATFSMDGNISLENLLKDENIDVKEMEFGLLTRSQSSKMRKRVSFRLPEVSDIIILYPPEVEFEK